MAAEKQGSVIMTMAALEILAEAAHVTIEGLFRRDKYRLTDTVEVPYWSYWRLLGRMLLLDAEEGLAQ